MKKSLTNKNNRKLSKRNQHGGNPSNPLESPYLYMIYTESLSAEGVYLYHIRYIGFNLIHVFQYYHSLHTEFTELLTQRHLASNVHPIILRQARGFNTIGQHFAELSQHGHWLQNPTDINSTAKIINAFNFNAIYRRNALDHLVRNGINTNAYDSYFPYLVQLNTTTGRINRELFFDPEIDEISISSDVPYDDRLYNMLDNGQVLVTSYPRINQMPIIQNKSITLEFLDDLGMFHSQNLPDEQTQANVRNIINKRYPNAKELNSIRILPDERTNINVLLSNNSYTFNIPVVGLEISSYNIVLSNQFVRLVPYAEEVPFVITCIAPITQVINENQLINP